MGWAELQSSQQASFLLELGVKTQPCHTRRESTPLDGWRCAQQHGLHTTMTPSIMLPFMFVSAADGIWAEVMVDTSGCR